MRLLVVSASWVAGVAVALQWSTPPAALSLFLVASIALAMLFRLARWSLLFPIAITFMLFGVLRVELAAPPSEGFQSWLEVEDLRLEGLVIEDPEDRGGAIRFRFQVQRLNLGEEWQDARDDILVFARPFPDIHYGDRLLLLGSLDKAPVYSDFDYREYLARR